MCDAQIAQLAEKEDVEHTALSPDVAKREVAAEHVVHAEASNHETHVRVATHTPRLDASGQPIAAKADEVGQAAAAPPAQSSQDYILRFSERLDALTAAVQGIGGAAATGGGGAADAHVATT